MREMMRAFCLCSPPPLRTFAMSFGAASARSSNLGYARLSRANVLEYSSSLVWRLQRINRSSSKGFRRLLWA